MQPERFIFSFLRKGRRRERGGEREHTGSRRHCPPVLLVTIFSRHLSTLIYYTSLYAATESEATLCLYDEATFILFVTKRDSTSQQS